MTLLLASWAVSSEARPERRGLGRVSAPDGATPDGPSGSVPGRVDDAVSDATGQDPGADGRERHSEPGADLRRVPRLVGLPADEARQRLRLSEFRPCVGVFYLAPQNWRDGIDPAAVGLQAPQPGTTAPSGSSVGCWRFVRAAASQKTLKTPDLIGKRWSEARDLIGRSGLRPAEGPAIRDLRDDDIVADQYPHPDQVVYERTSVLVNGTRVENAR